MKPIGLGFKKRFFLNADQRVSNSQYDTIYNLTLRVQTAGYPAGHTSLVYEARDNPQNSAALPENFLTYPTGLKGLMCT